VRIAHVAPDQVGELYRLADVMAHAAIFEPYRLALVGTVSTGLLIRDLLHWCVAGVLSGLRPDRGYRDIARFSRSYVRLILRSLWSR